MFVPLTVVLLLAYVESSCLVNITRDDCCSVTVWSSRCLMIKVNVPSIE